jgi:hypothetical protein
MIGFVVATWAVLAPLHPFADLAAELVRRAGFTLTDALDLRGM